MPKETKFADDLWVVLKPAPDMPGTWVSHCLNLDLLSQGDSPAHAFEMMIEALTLTIKDDLAAGLDPKRRGTKTPSEDWEEVARIAREGHRIPLSGLKREEVLAVAVNFTFALKVPKNHGAKRTLVEPVPSAWQIAASRPDARAST